MTKEQRFVTEISKVQNLELLGIDEYNVEEVIDMELGA